MLKHTRHTYTTLELFQNEKNNEYLTEYTHDILEVDIL